MPLVPPLVPAEALQDWQTAFSLAPNVRFTRTPENQISRRKTPESEAASASPIAEQQARIETAFAPAAEPTPADMVTAAPSLSTAPRAVAPMPGWVRQPVEPIVLAEANTESDRQQPAPHAVSQAAPVLANLSDFAFWDAMPFSEEDLPVVSSFAQFQPIAMPTIRTAQESPVSLYRIIDLRPAAVQELR
jgi:S-DNA-T family DNA segregation ATPase FtsK/SpoIIIE